MNKYVFISFIFMGWVFFELSGGTDFETPTDPARSTVTSTPLQTPVPVVPVEIRTTALTLPATAPADETSESKPTTAVAVISTEPEATLEPANTVDLTTTPPVTLVSLEQSREKFGGLLENFDPNAIRLSETTTANLGPEMIEEPELPVADLRTISGVRVNMRNGPGTTYDVLMRLTLGDEVEVLDDSGSGWLRLRLVSNRTVGWISASLVSKPLR
jgi:Bacterial SH3 domain